MKLKSFSPSNVLLGVSLFSLPSQTQTSQMGWLNIGRSMVITARRLISRIALEIRLMWKLGVPRMIWILQMETWLYRFGIPLRGSTQIGRRLQVRVKEMVGGLLVQAAVGVTSLFRVESHIIFLLLWTIKQCFFVAEGIKSKCWFSYKGTHDVNTRPFKEEVLIWEPVLRIQTNARRTDKFGHAAS